MKRIDDPATVAKYESAIYDILWRANDANEQGSFMIAIYSVLAAKIADLKEDAEIEQALGFLRRSVLHFAGRPDVQ